MSQSEVERLVKDLRTDATLRAQVEKNGLPASMVAIARDCGYDITLDDLKALAAARARAAGRELSPADLGAIAAGIMVPSREEIIDHQRDEEWERRLTPHPFRR